MNVISKDTCRNLGELRATLDVVLNSLGDKVLIVNMNGGEYKVSLVEGLTVE